MVNFVAIYESVIYWLMKLAGVSPLQVDLEPGTTMGFWVPSETIKKHEPTNEPQQKMSKPAVVLVHGFSADGVFNWQFQILALAKSYSVYVPDLMFFGKSTSDKKDDRSPTFQAHCLAAALQRLGVNRYTLVGFSYGGFVSFKLAELYPDRVEAMVISGSAAMMTETILNDLLKRTGCKSLSDLLIPKSVNGMEALRKLTTQNLPSFRNRLTKDFMKLMYCDGKEMETLLQALVVKDTNDHDPIYPQIIHLLWGERDRIFPKELARSLKEKLGAKATYQEIKKAGHLVHLERPWVYNNFLKEFLNSLHFRNLKISSYNSRKGVTQHSPFIFSRL